MAEPQVPVAVDTAATTLLTVNEDWRTRLRKFAAEPAMRRALPGLVALGVVSVLAALYLAIADGPQRTLYSGLTDGERAKVVETLERSGIGYTIDNATGALTVSEGDVYRARMMVASDAGLAAPQGASEMLDAIPLGSSRTLEGERLRLARERELMLTIREIDGIESVRVHLATPERSVFVRSSSPPSASVMVRLVSGRSLSQRQVEAIVNLVSGSVPGMTADTVRVVDQNGRLLTSERDGTLDRLVLQREFESKLRGQVTALLIPLLGEGNFSSQVQVELDQSEITSARESYDSEGAVRSESERLSTRLAARGTGGVPGVAANTPPPDAELVDGPPGAQAGDGAQDAGDAAQPQASDRESMSQRQYELGREVAVTSTRPGGLVKLSVAVAVSDAALEAAAPLTSEQLRSLVLAAVGASEARGDQVEVVVSAFDATDAAPIAFYEAKWFSDVLRYGAALIAVVLVLLLAVRPLIARMRSPADAGTKKAKKARKGKDSDEEIAADSDSNSEEAAVMIENGEAQPAIALAGAGSGSALPGSGDNDSAIPQKVELARRFAAAQPDRAVEALKRMLEMPEGATGR
ncbi:flagellar basal-body MS-ring/collar protein FliF [Qipengyuania nanhaisediminis]|uniref:flagellar basal-body MS-ring/collar protein FliF n=1 Tax=Qipengyuania nanhaisediminis TaxID=604088 RepID=UPI0038B2B9AD